jgi:hypothetical protein
MFDALTSGRFRRLLLDPDEKANCACSLPLALHKKKSSIPLRRRHLHLMELSARSIFSGPRRPDPHLLELAAPIHICCEEAPTPERMARSQQTTNSYGSGSGRPEVGQDAVIRSASSTNQRSSRGSGAVVAGSCDLDPRP